MSNDSDRLTEIEEEISDLRGAGGRELDEHERNCRIARLEGERDGITETMRRQSETR